MAEPDPFGVDGGEPFVASEGDRPEPDGHELPPIPPAPGEGLELWVGEEQVRTLLMAQGSLLHGALALDKGSDEWVYLQAELDAIVPPLTRIVNRYEPLQRLAVAGDPLAVALAMGGYVQRSIRERAATSASIQAAEAETPTADVAFHGPRPTP